MKPLSEYLYFNATDKNGENHPLLISPFEFALSSQRLEEYPEARLSDDGESGSSWVGPQPGPFLEVNPRFNPLWIGGAFFVVVFAILLGLTCGGG